MTFEQAACLPLAGFTALQGLRKGGIRAGQNVLINGAGAGVGSLAVPIAKALGAHVTGVTRARNAQMVRSIGADEVIDYTREDFARLGQRYDLILDCHATRPLLACRRVLNPGGVYVMIGGPIMSSIDPLLLAIKCPRLVVVRKPEIPPVDGEEEPGGSRDADRARERRKARAGDRQAVSTERNPRGDPACDGREHRRKGRHHNGTRQRRLARRLHPPFSRFRLRERAGVRAIGAQPSATINPESSC